MAFHDGSGGVVAEVSVDTLVELKTTFRVCRRGIPGRQLRFRSGRVGRDADRIYCTVSPPLSGVMKDCSIVRVTSAAANALSLKMLYVYVTTHVRLPVERSRRSRASKTAVVGYKYDGEMPDSNR